MVVSVDGTNVSVDLTNASTLGDVVSEINNAINGVTAGAGSLAVSANGFTLTAASGHTIQIGELAGGDTAAADLGIDISASGTTTGGGHPPPA